LASALVEYHYVIYSSTLSALKIILAVCLPASTFGRFADARRLGNGSHTIALRGYSVITSLS
jgi:hypothetical protein